MYPIFYSMQTYIFAAALIGLLAVDGAKATCPTCTDATGGSVCAKTKDGKLKLIANLCEMNRLNCITNRLDYTLSPADSCSPTPATSVDKLHARGGKVFTMPGAMQYGPQCGNCAGTATSAVCGRNAQGRLVNFVNNCWLQLNNCHNPNWVYTFVNNGYCATHAAAAAGGQKGTAAADGVSGHPNIGLINAAECGKIPASSKILNGQDAGLLQYPWAVHLTIVESAAGMEYVCGGSIISPRYVLTAGHCASGFDHAITITAVVGDYKLSTSSDCAYIQGRFTCAAQAQTVGVEKVIVHPSYNNNTDDGNDLTLLRLTKALDFSTPSVKPVCLPVGSREETRQFSGEMLTIIGWGVTASGASGDTLQMATVPGIGARTCELTYGGGTRILDGQLCAGGNLKDSCSGDSGGPIMYTNLAGSKMTEYGLVSYGVVCGSTDNIPGVYTRVGYYMKWILDNMRP